MVKHTLFSFGDQRIVLVDFHAEFDDIDPSAGSFIFVHFFTIVEAQKLLLADSLFFVLEPEEKLILAEFGEFMALWVLLVTFALNVPNGLFQVRINRISPFFQFWPLLIIQVDPILKDAFYNELRGFESEPCRGGDSF